MADAKFVADARFVADAKFVADATVCSSAFTPSMEELGSDCFSLMLPGHL